jgi:MFS family permease
MKGDVKFEIASAYPQLHDTYGLLVGLAFTVPYSIAGLYAGNMTKTGNRKQMMIFTILALSCFQLTTGIVDSFAVMVAMRFLHGMISSAVNPLAFSLMSDYFPQDKRSTANSIISSGNFIGIALSSMTILLIKAVGWR